MGHDDELAWCGGGVGGGATGASGFGGDGGAGSGGEGADGSGGASGASGLGGIGGIGCIGCIGGIGGIGGSGAGGEPGGGAVSLGACSGPVPAPCVPETRALFLFSGPIPPAASVPTPAAAITASARANAAHRRLGLAHMASSPLLWPRTEARSLSTLKFLLNRLLQSFLSRRLERWTSRAEPHLRPAQRLMSEIEPILNPPAAPAASADGATRIGAFIERIKVPQATRATVAILIAMFLCGAASPEFVAHVALVPGRTIPYMWNVFTASWLEVNPLGLIVSCAAAVLAGASAFLPDPASRLSL